MKLYNSLTNTKEEFKPFDKNNVKMYVCGITPYDTTHIGHAFTYIFFDTLLRYLQYKDYKTTYTQNITDINDRDNDILKRAEVQGVSWQNLANFWTDKFLRDMHSLNWIMPDNFLWASAHIETMIKLIEHLLKNKIAYVADSGIYLDVTAKKDFGKLSKFSKEKMLRVAKEFDEDLDNPYKRNRLDITLWRSTSENQSVRIPSFESPFGPGRPGWHIECSAMSICSLGKQIDIHGGGIDLIYPHHESEIAQSEGATGKIPFAKYWLHTGTVFYKGKKMSKSLGNLVLVSDLLQKYSANALRFVLLSHHYRESFEFKEEDLIDAEKKINRLQSVIGSYSSNKNNESKINNGVIEQFNNLLDDDMGTPSALEFLLESVENGNAKVTKTIAVVMGFKF